MDFNNLLEIAQVNKNTKTNTKGFSTAIAPAKKPPKSNVQSDAVRKFLEKREQMERQKDVEARKQREKLLMLRAQNSKSNKAAKLMSSRTKDNDFSKIRLTEDQIEVKQKMEAQIQRRMLTDKVERMKERIKLQEQEDATPHKRKRKHKVSSEPETKVQTLLDLLPPEKKMRMDGNWTSVKPKENSKKFKTGKAPAAPLSFNELLKIAADKQNSTVDSGEDYSDDEEDYEDDRLMTVKERRKFVEEQNHNSKAKIVASRENVQKTTAPSKRSVENHDRNRIPRNREHAAEHNGNRQQVNSRPSMPQNSRTPVPQNSRGAVSQSSRPSAPQNSRPASSQSSRPVSQNSRPATSQNSRPSMPQNSRPPMPHNSRQSVSQNGRTQNSQNDRPQNSQNDRPQNSQNGRPPSSQTSRPPSSQNGRPPSSQNGRPSNSQNGRPSNSQNGRPSNTQHSQSNSRLNPNSKPALHQNSRPLSSNSKPPFNSNSSHEPNQRSDRPRPASDSRPVKAPPKMLNGSTKASPAPTKNHPPPRERSDSKMAPPYNTQANPRQSNLGRNPKLANERSASLSNNQRSTSNPFNRPQQQQSTPKPSSSLNGRRLQAESNHQSARSDYQNVPSYTTTKKVAKPKVAPVRYQNVEVDIFDEENTPSYNTVNSSKNQNDHARNNALRTSDSRRDDRTNPFMGSANRQPGSSLGGPRGREDAKRIPPVNRSMIDSRTMPPPKRSVSPSTLSQRVGPVRPMRHDPYLPSKSLARNPYKKLPPITSSRPTRRIESDEEDEEDDDEMKDFIDDDPIADFEDYSQQIQEIFGYDKNRYLFEEELDDEAMESSYAEQMKEELRSARLGFLEDLEDIRKEAEERKMKKQKRV